MDETGLEKIRPLQFRPSTFPRPCGHRLLAVSIFAVKVVSTCNVNFQKLRFVINLSLETTRFRSDGGGPPRRGNKQPQMYGSIAVKSSKKHAFADAPKGQVAAKSRSHTPSTMSLLGSMNTSCSFCGAGTLKNSTNAIHADHF